MNEAVTGGGQEGGEEEEGGGERPSAPGSLDGASHAVCGEGPLASFLVNSINLDPLWINTFIKYNKNESLEQNE